MVIIKLIYREAKDFWSHYEREVFWVKENQIKKENNCMLCNDERFEQNRNKLRNPLIRKWVWIASFNIKIHYLFV